MGQAVFSSIGLHSTQRLSSPPAGDPRAARGPIRLVRSADIAPADPDQHGDVPSATLPAATAQEQEFSRLWLQHKAELYALCVSLMGGNPADAEDALSRAALLALEKYSRYAGELQNPKAWLKRLVFNSSIDLLRERRRAQQVLTPEGECPQEPAVHTEPEWLYLQRELGRCLQQFIAELPARLQQPVVLRLVHAREYSEIARRLAITEENARKLVQLGRMRLRKALTNYLEPHEP